MNQRNDLYKVRPCKKRTVSQFCVWQNTNKDCFKKLEFLFFQNNRFNLICNQKFDNDYNHRIFTLALMCAFLVLKSTFFSFKKYSFSLKKYIFSLKLTSSFEYCNNETQPVSKILNIKKYHVIINYLFLQNNCSDSNFN